MWDLTIKTRLRGNRYAGTTYHKVVPNNFMGYNK
jgi:hypothetical protein